MELESPTMLEATDATHFDEELVRLAVQELVDRFDEPTVAATKLCEASLKASSSRRESASSQKLSSYTSQWWCYAGWLWTTPYKDYCVTSVFVKTVFVRALFGRTEKYCSG